MNVTVELHLYARGTRWMQSGSFPVNLRAYKEDAKKESVRVAYEWFRKINGEYNYEAILEKALCNEEDITEELLKMIKSPL